MWPLENKKKSQFSHRVSTHFIWRKYIVLKIGDGGESATDEPLSPSDVSK